jgi:hypothetical protein
MKTRMGHRGRTIAWKIGAASLAVSAASALALAGAADAKGITPLPGLLPTTTTLQITPNPVHQGANVTFTATVTGHAFEAAPTGNVVIEAVNCAGVVTTSYTFGTTCQRLLMGGVCTTGFSGDINIAPGVMMYKAVYQGNGLSRGSSSSVVSLTIEPPA